MIQFSPQARAIRHCAELSAKIGGQGYGRKSLSNCNLCHCCRRDRQSAKVPPDENRVKMRRIGIHEP